MAKPDIFVFGSNLAGIHGAGSAKEAYKKHGAVWGKGNGLYGDSYAIPTKDAELKTLPLPLINHYIGEFIRLARDTPARTYRVVNVGCGLAGYTPQQIAPLFKTAPKNCKLSTAFLTVLTEMGITRQ